jgi:DNA topoisomerase-3
MTLIDVVPKELKSPETTGKWEKGLSSISKASMNPNRFMDSIVKYVNYLTDYAKNTQTSAVFPQEARKYASTSPKNASPNAKTGAKDKTSASGAKAKTSASSAKKKPPAASKPKAANPTTTPRKTRQKKTKD